MSRKKIHFWEGTGFNNHPRFQWNYFLCVKQYFDQHRFWRKHLKMEYDPFQIKQEASSSNYKCGYFCQNVFTLDCENFTKRWLWFPSAEVWGRDAVFWSYSLQTQRRQPALKLKKREKTLLNNYLLTNFHDCLAEQSTVKQMKWNH